MTPAEGRAVRWAALGAVAALALVVAGLSWSLAPGGGLRGVYSIEVPDGTLLKIHERVDPRIDFPVPQPIDAAYVFHFWDEQKVAFPAAMPPYAIRWRGLLRVPETGRYGFWLDAQGEVALRIDGRAVETRTDAITERPLRAGLHALEIDYALEEGEARIVLNWRPPGGELAPVPSRHLGVDRDAFERGRARRLAGLAILAAAAAAAGALLLAARRPAGGLGRLFALLSAGRTRIALGAVLLLAASLRFHDYSLVPFHHETADEYQHAWDGWSLLHEGVPASWSTFPSRYPVDRAYELRWFGDRYALVWPYFDHPPLFSLLVGLGGAIASVLGLAPAPPPEGLAYRVFGPDPPLGGLGYLVCSLPVMRVVPILLSLAGIILLYRLAREYGATERGALCATLVYASLPVIVLSHRLVKAESLLALLFMGAILLVRRLGRTGAAREAALIGAVCGLAIWTKATGMAVVGTALVLLLAARRYRAASLVAALAGGSVLLYLLYAWAYDFDIFVKIVQAQSATKWASLDSFLDLMSGKVVVKWFGRGWYLFLLLAAGVAAFRKERALLVPVAIYATLIALSADHRVVYGWYRIPLFPFLCVAAGIYLDEMIRESDLFRTFPFALTAVVTGLLYTFSGAPFSTTAETASRFPMPASLVQTKTAVALFSFLALAPYLLRLAHERPWTRRVATAATCLLVALFLLTSVAAVGGMLETYHLTRGVR
ncbi:MAG: glycosyltransferase family 39 protein [Acidobacteriota bacterium]